MAAGEHGVHTEAAPGPVGAESGFEPGIVTAQPNGGRTCFGNSYEFQLCSQEECPPLTDFREEQCKAWDPFYEHDGRKHHWLPYQHPDPDERCRLYCQSKETAAVVSMNRIVHDGTPCSYADSHSLCVRGECEHVGCDGQIASDKQEDRCGVCGGDNTSCKIVKGNFTRSTKKQGYLKILEIPKGARHLLVQEFKGTPHILAVKNQETSHLFLNSEDEHPESRVVIEKGVMWEYSNTAEKESIQTTGPLNYGVLLMVHSQGDSKVTVSYKYIIQNRLRSSLESNLLTEDAIFYEWALKRWSHCSKPCGGGKQYTRFGCRRKADGKMVPRTFCSNINKPRAISRNCNSNACSPPRWATGEWETCSASCGQTGWQRRWVSCQQTASSGQQQERSVPSKLCGENRPMGKQTCNRFPCPASWRRGPWTRCSVSCGNGTQERQVVCSSPETSFHNCSEPRPITKRTCQAPPCNGDHKNSIVQWLSRSNTNFSAPKVSSRQQCRADRSVFCRMEALTRYCSNAGYRQMCCKSCSKENISNSDNSSSSSNVTFSSTNPPSTSARSSITEAMTSVFTSSWSYTSPVIRNIISTPSLSFSVTLPPTSESSTSFLYVDYSDYDEYYEDLSGTPETTANRPTTDSGTSTTVTNLNTTNTGTARLWLETTPPDILDRTTTSTSPPTVVPIIPSEGENQSLVPIRTSAVLQISTTNLAETDGINSTTPSPSNTSEGRSSPAQKNQTVSEPSPSLFPSLLTLSKKENNSVDEVPYQIVGLDRELSRGQHSYFVPRLPPFRERTQNKRIQQLLNEKRRQDVLRRSSRSRDGRTDSRQDGL